MSPEFALMSVASQLGLHDLPELIRDDGLMLPRLGIAAIRDFASVQSVLQHLVERPAGKLLAP